MKRKAQCEKVAFSRVLKSRKPGKLSWMATSPWEKAQVGHYFLLKQDYSEAWKWYEQAERELPPATPLKPEQSPGELQRLTGPRDFTFFQYYCLAKLGKPKEAQAKLEQFRRNFLPQVTVPTPSTSPLVPGFV